VVTDIVNLGTKFVNRIPETFQLISIGRGSLWVWLHCYCYQIRIFFGAAKHLLQLLCLCCVLFLTAWLMFRVLYWSILNKGLKALSNGSMFPAVPAGCRKACEPSDQYCAAEIILLKRHGFQS